MKAVLKKVEKKFVEIDGVLIDYDEMIDLIEAIDGTDGMFNAVTIYDAAMAKILVDRGIAGRNARGSHYCADDAKRAAFASELFELEFPS